MINILLGPPGAGKSYEATVYHILPALARGRKVITNLPLNLQALASIDASYTDLVELREKTLATEPAAPVMYAGRGESVQLQRIPEWSSRAFANPEDFADTWRHPEGFGPLYVVDECHFCFPAGRTHRGVEEWFSMHRHYNADVLLITQSAGKISRPIVDLVQVCYKVRKAVALGQNDSYIRKVLDGVKGAVVSEDVRKYKPQMFQLWRSHTQGVAAPEVTATDVGSIVQRFKRFRNVYFVVVVVACAYAFWPAGDKKTATQAKPDRSAVQQVAGQSNAGTNPSPDHPTVDAPTDAPLPPSGPPEPFNGKGLHLTGVLTMAGRTVYTFAISVGAQRIGTTDSVELAQVGYKFEPLTACVGYLRWANDTRAITCDAPAVPQATNDRPVVVAVDQDGRRVASSISTPSQTVSMRASPAVDPHQISQAELAAQLRQEYGPSRSGLRF